MRMMCNSEEVNNLVGFDIATSVQDFAASKKMCSLWRSDWTVSWYGGCYSTLIVIRSECVFPPKAKNFLEESKRSRLSARVSGGYLKLAVDFVHRN
jgi:hypothetical protein